MSKWTKVFAVGAMTVVGAHAHGGDSVALAPVDISMHTGEKPQSKLWKHGNTWFAALPSNAVSPAGTWVWRLESDDTWSNILHISDNTVAQCDAKRVGGVVHVLVHELEGASAELVSIEHVVSDNSYQPWAPRPTTTDINFPGSSETATVDVDSIGDMWIATDDSGVVNVHHAASPYDSFSGPITLETGIHLDDIAAVASLPNGSTVVVWTNQIARRFGCRVHIDGADPADWSADEVPSEQSADDAIGMGMADDHINLAVGSDSTLYMVVKTGFNTIGYPDVGLLVRRAPDAGPGGATWDDLYFVEQDGTRAIAMVNELTGVIRVAYKQDDPGQDLPYVAYRDASIEDFEFGAVQTLFDVGLAQFGVNNPTSTKELWTSDVVYLCAGDKDIGVAPGLRMLDGVAAPEGACCLGNQGCTFGNSEDCESQGGIFEGEDISCEDVVCEQTDDGACCLADGSCTFGTAEDCAGLGGAFQGLGQLCGEVACPQPEPEGCCIGATCFDVFADICLVNGGTPQGEGTSCADVTCESPLDPCAADVDTDGMVGVLDLVMVITGWGACGSGCTADINRDLLQDVQDLIQVINNWGPCP